MTWLLLVLAALAATRWATLVTRDTFGPIAQVRDWIEYRWPHDETVFYADHVITLESGAFENRAGVPLTKVDGSEVWMAARPHPLGTLVTCVRCMSVWTGLAAMAVVVLAPASVALVVFAPFAFSQVAIWLTRAD